MTDILKRLRIILPGQSEGQSRLEEEAAQEIERLLKIEIDMKSLQEMYRRNSLSSYSDDMDELAKIMTPNVE